MIKSQFVRLSIIGLTAVILSCSAEERSEEKVKSIGHVDVVGEAIDLEDFRKYAETQGSDGHAAFGDVLQSMEKYEEATVWFRRAADAGNVRGQVGLGKLYAGGHEQLVGVDEAEKWLRIAAAQNDSEAHSLLGWMILREQVRSNSTREAESHFMSAIEFSNSAQEIVPAYIGMANVSYAESDAVSSAKWTRQAAELGSPVAQIMLGNLYRAGAGVPQNSAFAYFWYSLGTSQSPNPTAAGFRDEVGSSLSKAKLAEVQEQVADWVPAQTAKEARARMGGN